VPAGAALYHGTSSKEKFLSKTKERRGKTYASRVSVIKKQRGLKALKVQV
jgi:hypothetical protein